MLNFMIDQRARDPTFRTQTGVTSRHWVNDILMQNTDRLIFLVSAGERGAAYACQPESGHPAQIMYKPYSGWASSNEWTFMLPESETVIALAAGGTPPSGSLRNKTLEGDIEGNGNVVVATSRGYLRFFTGGGVQRYIWGLGADVVTMVAGCEWVFVVHRDGGTSLDGKKLDRSQTSLTL